MNRGQRVWIVVATLLLVALVGWLLWVRSTYGPDKTWERVLTTGVWRVGMDPSFPPFETLDANGHPIGFDVDLANALVARWGVRVSFEGIGFDGLLDALQAGRVDAVLSALPVDPRFARDVAYSIPYFEAGLVLAVPDGEVSVNGLDDLVQRRVAVEWGSQGDAQARELRRRLPRVEVVPYQTPDEALSAVVTSEADAALVDGVSARTFLGREGGIRIVEPPVVPDPYVIAVPIKASKLLQAVNDGLVALRKDGTLAELERKWLGSGTPSRPE
ncbi:MAG TPA: transporter substrate-binding domain-containing protein [Anaerolineae bacterium]|nr:transporter substrate-binding domain-containing protein [Anaerolineae bacterium]HIQ05536.1 transporter substrate-binding domain-containing protein [Anaerolineae bacterium]